MYIYIYVCVCICVSVLFVCSFVRLARRLFVSVGDLFARSLGLAFRVEPLP